MAMLVTGVKSASASKGIALFRCGMIRWIEALIRKVAPSGAARATTSEPITPEAPARFSTTMGWPSSCAQPLGDDAAEDVGRAAGRVGHDETDGTAVGQSWAPAPG